MAVEPREIERYRLALQRQIGATSLRATARDVGVSPSGLYNLAFRGAVPYARTLRLLREWYVRRNSFGAELSPETARAAFEALLHGVPPAARAEAELALTDVLKSVHRLHHGRPPRWLGNLIEDLKTRAEPSEGGQVERAPRRRGPRHMARRSSSPHPGGSR
jgi:hypothetical protein